MSIIGLKGPEGGNGGIDIDSLTYVIGNHLTSGVTQILNVSGSGYLISVSSVPMLDDTGIVEATIDIDGGALTFEIDRISYANGTNDVGAAGGVPLFIRFESALTIDLSAATVPGFTYVYALD